jgi:hypothetical protein
MLKWYENLPPGVLDPRWREIRSTILSPVCEPCQQLLNTQFEQPAKELLKALFGSSSMILTTEQQVILSRWLVKTALLLILCPGRVGSAPALEGIRRHLDELTQRGSIPPFTTVRIGQVHRESSATIWPFLPAVWSEDRRFDVSSVLGLTGVAGEIVLHGDPQSLPFADLTKNDPRLAVIWPPQLTNVLWPPSQPLSLLDIVLLRAEWGTNPLTEVFGNFPPVAPFDPEPPGTPSQPTE